MRSLSTISLASSAVFLEELMLHHLWVVSWVHLIMYDSQPGNMLSVSLQRFKGIMYIINII
jgi:hypothetical protein